MRQRHGVPALRAHPSLWSLDDPAQLIRRACRRYSNGTISPHGLRRYFATQWLARAGSESSLIRLCGWTSGAMLRTYTAANTDALALTEYRRLAHPGDDLIDEPARTALGVRGALAHPRVQHLAGVGPCRQQRVVTQHLRVAERRACLAPPDTLADRRVHIDDEASPLPAPHPPTTPAAAFGDYRDFEHRNRRCSGGTFRGYARQLTDDRPVDQGFLATGAECGDE